MGNTVTELLTKTVVPSGGHMWNHPNQKPFPWAVPRTNTLDFFSCFPPKVCPVLGEIVKPIILECCSVARLTNFNPTALKSNSAERLEQLQWILQWRQTVHFVCHLWDFLSLQSIRVSDSELGLTGWHLTLFFSCARFEFCRRITVLDVLNRSCNCANVVWAFQI